MRRFPGLTVSIATGIAVLLALVLIAPWPRRDGPPVPPGQGPRRPPEARSGPARTPAELGIVSTRAFDGDTHGDAHVLVLEAADAKGGARLAGARFEVVGPPSGAIEIEAMDGGLARLASAAPMAVRVRASAPGWLAEECVLAVRGEGHRRWVLEPARDVVLRVQVAETGALVAGATVGVAAAIAGEEEAGHTIWEAETGESGEVLCPAVVLARAPAAGTLRARASAPGLCEAEDVVPRSTDRVILWLHAERRVRVRVRDASGAPVHGARLRWVQGMDLGRAWRWQGPAETGADGEASVALRATSESAVVEARAGDVVGLALVAGDELSATIALPAGSRGFRLEAAGGTPLAGVALRIVPYAGKQLGGLVEAVGARVTSGSDGRVAVPFAPGGLAVQATIDAPSQFAGWTRLFAPAELEDPGPTVVLAGGRDLVVRARSSDESDLCGATVVAVPSGGSAPAWAATFHPSRSMAPGPAGSGEVRTTLPLPPAFEGHVVVVCPGYAPVAARVPPGASEIALSLDPGIPLTVKVTDQDGMPVAGARVFLHAPSRSAGEPVRLPAVLAAYCRSDAVTGPDGSALLLALAVPAAIHVETADDVFREQGLTEEHLRAGLVELQVRTREDLEIRVVDPERRPIAGAVVLARLPGGGGMNRSARVTDRNGIVTIRLPRIAHPRPGETITLHFSGAAVGESVVKLHRLFSQREVVAVRGEIREITLLVEASGGLAEGAQDAAYAIVRGAGGGVLGSGTVRIAEPRAVSVPAGVGDLAVRISPQGGPPQIFPLPDEARRLVARLATGHAVVFVNRTREWVEAQVVDVASGHAWNSPPIPPGGRHAARLLDAPRQALVHVVAPPSLRDARAWIRASEAREVWIGDEGVSVLAW
jgi:hypothetical protein